MFLRFDIKDCIQQIETPLKKIGARSLLPDFYSDTVNLLKSEQALLFMKGESFVVLKPIVEQGTPKILVWAVYGRHGNSIKKHLPQFKRIAKEIGTEALQFWTNIPGLQRYYPRLGARYVRDFQHLQIWEISL